MKENKHSLVALDIESGRGRRPEKKRKSARRVFQKTLRETTSVQLTIRIVLEIVGHVMMNVVLCEKKKKGEDRVVSFEKTTKRREEGGRKKDEPWHHHPMESPPIKSEIRTPRMLFPEK